MEKDFDLKHYMPKFLLSSLSGAVALGFTLGTFTFLADMDLLESFVSFLLSFLFYFVSFKLLKIFLKEISEDIEFKVSKEYGRVFNDAIKTENAIKNS